MPPEAQDNPYRPPDASVGAPPASLLTGWRACRAVCPVCCEPVSRSGYFHHELVCSRCGAMLRQKALWNWLGNVAYGTAIGALIVLARRSLVPWHRAAGGMFLVVALGYLTFPFTARYRRVPSEDE